jgi:hypothetical protein
VMVFIYGGELQRRWRGVRMLTYQVDMRLARFMISSIRQTSL